MVVHNCNNKAITWISKDAYSDARNVLPKRHLLGFEAVLNNGFVASKDQSGIKRLEGQIARQFEF